MWRSGFKLGQASGSVAPARTRRLADGGAARQSGAVASARLRQLSRVAAGRGEATTRRGQGRAHRWHQRAHGAAPSPAAVPAAPAPEAPTRKRRPNHSPSKTDVLLAWFDEHVVDPYPSPKAKRALASNAGLDVMQVQTCAPLPSARAPPARARAPRCTSLPARHRVHESKEAILAILAV